MPNKEQIHSYTKEVTFGRKKPENRYRGKFFRKKAQKERGVLFLCKKFVLKYKFLCKAAQSIEKINQQSENRYLKISLF